MKNDNQTMDRAIPVSEQRRRKLRRTAVAVAIAVAVLGAGAWLGTQMIPTLDRKALIISEVDRGTILCPQRRQRGRRHAPAAPRLAIR